MSLRVRAHPKVHPKARHLTKTEKNQVRKIIGQKIETKFFGFGQDNQSAITAGTIVDLSNMTQGLTDITRIGDKISLKKLLLRIKVTASTGGLIAGADNYDSVRILLFRWRENDGAIAPVVANLLTNVGTGTDLTVAPLNIDQKAVYQVLWDKTTVVYNSPTYNGSGMSTEPGFGHVKYYNINLFGKRLGPKQIRFINNGPSGVGRLFMMVISDSAFTPNPKFSYQGYLEYSDS